MYCLLSADCFPIGLSCFVIALLTSLGSGWTRIMQVQYMYMTLLLYLLYNLCCYLNCTLIYCSIGLERTEGLSRITAKTRHTVKYPNISFAIRPMPHSPQIPIPVPP